VLDVHDPDPHEGEESAGEDEAASDARLDGEALAVEEEPEEAAGDGACDGGEEGCKGASADGEVDCEEGAERELVMRVLVGKLGVKSYFFFFGIPEVAPVEPRGKEDGQEEADLAGGGGLPELAELFARGGLGLDDNLGTVCAVGLFGRGEQEGKGQGAGLQDDEDQEGHVVDLAGGGSFGVEAEVDGAADELARVLEGEPEREVAAALGVLGVGEHDGALGGPVEAGADAADGGAEHDEPLGAEAVVLVQGGAVDGPAERAEDERLLDADEVDEDGRQDAEQAHEPEHERVTAIDEVGQ